ncbi:MAG TPA: DEAD/DEAH box helicase, partial [Candidatus Aenigmarchaeota archaeon]|nr:DEAD/DEAH box helicase [Candidatus Aenigmarchaeota archaeon]
MLRFYAENIYTKVEVSTKQEETILRSLLSVYADGYKYSKAFKKGKWNGKVCFLTKKGYFPTGLLPYVVKKLPLFLRHNIELNDIRKKPQINKTKPNLNGLTLRDYQERCVVKACAKQRGVIWAPPGSGKTEIAIAIIAALNIPNTLYIVHQRDLLLQTAERIQKRLGVQVGVIGDRVFQINTVTVATIQSLWTKLKSKDPQTLSMLSNTNLLVLDECHHASANTWYKIAMKTEAYYRFGLSATPFQPSSLRNFRLYAATAAVIVDKISEQELLEKGYLCKPVIKMIRVGKPLPPRTPYQVAYEHGIVKNSLRNTIIADEAQKLVREGKSVLILVQNIEHGKILSELLNTTFLSGEESTSVRKEITKKFSSKQIKTLVATTIFDEGIDMPRLDAVILAAGGKSPIRCIQRIGRSMRVAQNKNHAVIIDFYDTSHKHLTRHSAERL